MGKTFLIDTNVILEFTSGLLPPNVNALLEDILDQSGFYISIINRIEVLGHPSATQTLADFLDTAITYHLTNDVIEQTINIRKVKKIKLPDAVIAATAMFHGHSLITRNIKDFISIGNLEVIDPYNLS
ncbi:hypothetical protein A0256_21710 [Mucilaginibacter sp. PAMC 26640]|nr:hypothetical protein A0256_21710 [Mucilaginibacter sp. PAMC 26640]